MNNEVDEAIAPSDAVPFGDWVRRQRRTLDLTQAALAQCVACAIDTVKKIETGARRPSMQMASRLANCLHVPAEMRPNFLHAGRTGFISHALSAPHAADGDTQVARTHTTPTSGWTNLPVQLTPFVGRMSEIATLTERIQQARLLTLTGTGGVGKTRLAIEVAVRLRDAFAGGVWLVELAPIENPALVPQTVTAAFKLLEQPDHTYVEALRTFLRDKHILLVLDNCEHVIGAAAELAEALLRTCPNLHILATSREPLRIPGEGIWRVPSLTAPDSPGQASLEELLDYEAIQLFTQTAALTLPGFALTPDSASAVAQICRRLDGIPLAIEMASAHVAVLSVEEIEAGLEDQLALLVGGSRTARLRHQTLRAALDWGYALLNPSEQLLLAQLSVFAGGCTAEAAQAICVAEHVSPLLLSLVHKSLVVAVPLAGHTRYRLLEVVRQYAAEKLAAHSADIVRALRDRHLAYYLALAEMSEPQLHTGQVAHWLGRLGADHDNLRAAIDWAFESQVAYGLRLVVALSEFWDRHHYYQEQREQLHKALRKSSPAERTAVRAKVLSSAGSLAWFYQEQNEARRLLDEALSIGLELNDQAIIAQSQLYRGWEAHTRDDYASARTCVEQALAIWRDLGDTFNMAFALLTLARQAEGLGDDREARQRLEEAVGMLDTLGEQTLRARALYRLARLALREGDLVSATALCKQSMNLILKNDYNADAAASCLVTFSSVALARGHSLDAAYILGAVARLLNELGIPIMRADAAEYDHMQAALRARLDATALEAALTEGKRMTFEQAVAFVQCTQS